MKCRENESTKNLIKNNHLENNSKMQKRTNNYLENESEKLKTWIDEEVAKKIIRKKDQLIRI